MKTCNIALCVPSLNEVSMDFCFSLLNLGSHLGRFAIPGFQKTQLLFINKRTSILPAAREMLVEDAIKQGADFVIFLDSDQIFPYDTVHRLIVSGKRIIGANIATKTLPAAPSARNSWREAQPVFSTGKNGLERVKYIGFGVTMIETSVFKQLPKPWFDTMYIPDLGHVGEDLYFCEQAGKAGIPIYIDHDLSLLVGHVGRYVYTHADVTTKVSECYTPVLSDVKLG